MFLGLYNKKLRCKKAIETSGIIHERFRVGNATEKYNGTT